MEKLNHVPLFGEVTTWLLPHMGIGRIILSMLVHQIGGVIGCSRRICNTTLGSLIYHHTYSVKLTLPSKVINL